MRQLFEQPRLSTISGEDHPGAPTKLTAAQMARLARIVRTKTPQQLKFEYALWTLTIIREVIRRQFGVRLSEVSVGRLMGRLGFTPQRPHQAAHRDLRQTHAKRTPDHLPNDRQRPQGIFEL